MKLNFARSTKLTASRAALALSAVIQICGPQKAEAQIGQSAGKVAAEFRDPGRQYRPHMRFWIPDAAVDEKVLRAQIDDIAAAGAGDIELVAFDFDRKPPNAPPTSIAGGTSIDHSVYGWGTPNWTNTMKILLDEAGKRGVKATFIMGPQWPISSPLLTKSSPGVEVQLACSKVDVRGNKYSGDVTGNRVRDGVSSELVAIVAGKRVSPDSTAPVDIKTLVNLTAKAVKNKKVNDRQAFSLNWKAPDDSGLWTLFFYWKEPVGEKVAGLYVVDHLGPEGTRAVTDYYKGVFDLLNKENLLKYANGLFADSLEYRSKIDWTGAFLATFKRLKGYDLTPYLPAINNGVNVKGAGLFSSGLGQEEFGDSGSKIRNDYYDVVTYLFNENHLKPIQAFLQGYGQNLRYQTAYGKRMEQASASMNIGIPEAEMMMIRNEFDNIRAQTGAVHLTNKIEYNAELQAELGKNHAQSWDNLEYFIQRAFAAGVNNMTFHGYNYNWQFSGPGNVDGHLPGVTWPGWEAFGRDGFSNSWGSEPLWAHARENIDFIARNAFVLKQGRPKIDLAIFRESFWDNASFTAKDGDTWYRDGGLLQDKGYSYDFVALANLQLPQASVTDGRLDAEGPAYKALILDQSLDALNGAAPAGNKSIGLDAANKILELARAGLPVVYIGEMPTKATFYYPEDQADRDRQVQAIMNDLKSLKNVRQAKTIDEVPDILQSIGVIQDAEVNYIDQENKSKLINIHRAADRVDYFYIYNRGRNDNSGFQYGWGYGAPKEANIPGASATITFKADGAPYWLDAWTGEVTPIAEYTKNGSDITIPLKLKFNESAIIAFDRGGALQAGQLPKSHATSISGCEAYYQPDANLAVKASSNGLCRLTLDNGSQKVIKVDGVPSPVSVRNWKLTVEDWNPGATQTSTAKSMIRVDLGDLKPWKEVPQLEFSSGIGTYTARFKMSKGWNQGVGAYLNLGIVNFGYKLKINGTQVKTSQVDTEIDVGPYLRAGDNVVEVEVATTLNNKLKKLYNVSARTLDYYGLLGSGATTAKDGRGGVVTVTPYRVLRVE